MDSKYITYIGVDDVDIDLFESQYVVPEGMCYDSYLVKGDRIAVMDTVDARMAGEWMAKLSAALGDRKPDYLVLQHMEPDHSGAVMAFLNEYPDTTIVCSQQAANFLLQFNETLRAEIRTVKEGDCLELGEGAELQFIAAPMVHWPEVMMTWFAAEKTLFSADGFGKFGVYDADPDDWACEARRYYFNICGKYGAQVAKVLQKAAGLDIQRICPLHGPVLTGDRLAEAVRLYTVWSSYKPETPEGILIAYASIHGNTAAAARRLGHILEAKGAPKVAVTDLCRDDVAEAVEDAFRMGTMVLACSTYDGGIFPPMKCFLDKLAMKGFCDRRVALVENGTWAPLAAKLMRASLESMKSIDILDRTLTIKSSLKESQVPELEALADLLLTPSSR